MYGHRLPGAEIECLAPAASCADRFSKSEVSVNPVFDKQVIALRCAVTADDRAASFNERAKRIRDDAGKVEISRAVEVGAAGHCCRQPEGGSKGAGDDVRTCFGGVIGVLPQKRHVLGVGKLILITIGLVT